ncbi:MAG: SAM-dependent methyltransferase [Bacteroidota bacterium]|nr:SAM-dependent methyltransferase [Bacteroidota bacterium]
MINLDRDYWDKKYHRGKSPGWDIGYASPPIMEYCNQLETREIDILIPGAGNAWEAEELYRKGFANVFILEFAQTAINNFLARMHGFPQALIIKEDFFSISGQYDLILEQTFFTSLLKEQRPDYVLQMHNLLKPHGKLAGLVFTHDFDGEYPPFGATREEYQTLFSPLFYFKTFEIAHNSITPRKGREYFMILEKKSMNKD